MKPLYTESEFLQARSIDSLKLECYHCHKQFLQRKSYIQQVLDKYKENGCRFCSSQCFHQSSIKRILSQCAHCSKPVIIKRSELRKPQRKTANVFCNNSCAAKYNNTHRTTGYRISKLETYLSTQLIILYPNLEFHFNRKDAISSELDIYIPSLKLAFELNGIFHYEPIYGKDKLESIQNNDNRKFHACLEQDISLCVIDTSSQLRFKESTSQKYLQIIVDIINSKLV